jgi:S1-C subfamily serine protease
LPGAGIPGASGLGTGNFGNSFGNAGSTQPSAASGQNIPGQVTPGAQGLPNVQQGSAAGMTNNGVNNRSSGGRNAFNARDIRGSEVRGNNAANRNANTRNLPGTNNSQLSNGQNVNANNARLNAAAQNAARATNSPGVVNAPVAAGASGAATAGAAPNAAAAATSNPAAAPAGYINSLGVQLNQAALAESGAGTLAGSTATGVTIDTVNPTSIAQQAGLLAGDEIFSINGTPVNSSEALNTALQNAGATTGLTTVGIRRNGTVQTFQVNLDIAAAAGAGAARTPAATNSGMNGNAATAPMRFGGLSFVNDQGGLRVSQLDQNSWAATAGLQMGDRVTSVNGQAINSGAQLIEQMRAASNLNGGTTQLMINRDGRQVPMTVTITPEAFQQATAPQAGAQQSVGQQATTGPAVSQQAVAPLATSQVASDFGNGRLTNALVEQMPAGTPNLPNTTGQATPRDIARGALVNADTQPDPSGVTSSTPGQLNRRQVAAGAPVNASTVPNPSNTTGSVNPDSASGIRSGSIDPNASTSSATSTTSTPSAAAQTQTTASPTSAALTDSRTSAPAGDSRVTAPNSPPAPSEEQLRNGANTSGGTTTNPTTPRDPANTTSLTTGTAGGNATTSTSIGAPSNGNITSATGSASASSPAGVAGASGTIGATSSTTTGSTTAGSTTSSQTGTGATAIAGGQLQTGFTAWNRDLATALEQSTGAIRTQLGGLSEAAEALAPTFNSPANETPAEQRVRTDRIRFQLNAMRSRLDSIGTDATGTTATQLETLRTNLERLYGQLNESP